MINENFIHNNNRININLHYSNSDTNLLLLKNEKEKENLEKNTEKNTKKNHLNCSSCEICHHIKHMIREDKKKLNSYLKNNESNIKLIGNFFYKNKSPKLYIQDEKNKSHIKEMELLPLPIKTKNLNLINNKEENKQLYNLQRSIVMLRRFQYNDSLNYDNHDILIKSIIYIQKISRGFLMRKDFENVRILFNTMNNFEILLKRIYKSRILYKIYKGNIMKTIISNNKFINKKNLILNEIFKNNIIKIQCFYRRFVSIKKKKYLIQKYIKFSVKNTICYFSKFTINKNVLNKKIDIIKTLFHRIHIKKNIKLKPKILPKTINKICISKPNSYVMKIQKFFIKKYHFIKIKPNKSICYYEKILLSKINIIDKINLNSNILFNKFIINKENTIKKIILIQNFYKRRYNNLKENILNFESENNIDKNINKNSKIYFKKIIIKTKSNSKLEKENILKKLPLKEKYKTLKEYSYHNKKPIPSSYNHYISKKKIELSDGKVYLSLFNIPFKIPIIKCCSMEKKRLINNEKEIKRIQIEYKKIEINKQNLKKKIISNQNYYINKLRIRDTIFQVKKIQNIIKKYINNKQINNTSKINKPKILNNYKTKERFINNEKKIIFIQKNFKVFSTHKNLITSIPKLKTVNSFYQSNDIKFSSNKSIINSNNLISESSNYSIHNIKELNISGFITKIYRKNIISIKKENILCFYSKISYREKIKIKNAFFINLLKLFIRKKIQEEIFYELKDNIKFKKVKYSFYIKTLKRNINFYLSSKKKEKEFEELFNEIFQKKKKKKNINLNKIISKLNKEEEKKLRETNLYENNENDLINHLSSFSKFDKNLTNKTFIKERLKSNNLKNKNIFSLTKFLDLEYNNLIYGKYCMKCFKEKKNCICTKEEEIEFLDMEVLSDEISLNSKINHFEYDSNKSKGIFIQKKPKNEEYNFFNIIEEENKFKVVHNNSIKTSNNYFLNNNLNINNDNIQIKNHNKNYNKNN